MVYSIFAPDSFAFCPTSRVSSFRNAANCSEVLGMIGAAAHEFFAIGVVE